MTDIREAREVIARHRWVPPGEYAPNEEDYAAADAIIAALSEAGITLCRVELMASDGFLQVVTPRYVPVSEGR